MKITNKLRIALKSILSIKCGEVNTDKATLIWDGDGELAEGMEVYVKDENDEVIPAEDGDYAAEDGKIITVAEGKVSAIKDAEEKEEKEEEPKEEEKIEAEEEPKPADEPETQEEPKTEERLAELEARMAEFTEGLNQLVNAIADLEARLAEAEGKLAKVEGESNAEPIEEPNKEEEMHKTRMSYLRKK